MLGIKCINRGMLQKGRSKRWLDIHIQYIYVDICVYSINTHFIVCVHKCTVKTQGTVSDMLKQAYGKKRFPEGVIGELLCLFISCSQISPQGSIATSGPHYSCTYSTQCGGVEPQVSRAQHCDRQLSRSDGLASSAANSY